MLIPFHELFARHKIRPRGVLHLGASTGQEAEEYEKHGITDVIWVEAIPEVFRHLVSHVAPLKHRCFNACLGDTDGKEVLFNVASNQGQSSSYLKFGTHATAHPNVTFTKSFKTNTIRVDTLLSRSPVKFEGPWFLNVDLQGAELLALRGMGELLYHFDWAYIEVNEKPLYIGCPLLPEMDDFMIKSGFARKEMKMTNWGWGDALYCRR